ncbi:hypothetical protein CPB84DRAFT_1692342, partial [Gymnopilus junonius]
WEDFQGGLMEDKIKDLDVSIQPVRLMLVKLCKFTFTIKNSTTILLPEWYQMLKALKLPECIMPHDVSMQWNLIYDMLEFTTQYHTAINSMMAACNFDLHK